MFLRFLFFLHLIFISFGNKELTNTSNNTSVKISYFLPDTLPLTELGKGLWKNYPGGLYPFGLNTRPAEHEIAGQAIAKSIQPLDSFGVRDDGNGKIVLLSIGMSNATQEFSVFKTMADSFRLKNPKLSIIDGAQGGQTALVIKDPNANFWNVITQRLRQQRHSSKQVQIAWIKEANANPNMPFPKHAMDLKSDLKSIVILLKQKYPNLKLIYLSSRTYGGFATSTLNPEPYAYETGFSVKWLIEDQIMGDSSLIYKGSEAKTAWLSWAAYLWAQGPKPRSDGFFYTREDFVQDGTHPSTSGRLKVARLLLDFFSTDSTCIPWFLKPTTTNAKNNSIDRNTFSIQSNHNETKISWKNLNLGKIKLILYNSNGQEIFQENSPTKEIGVNEIVISHNKLSSGAYYVQILSNEVRYSNKFIVQ